MIPNLAFARDVQGFNAYAPVQSNIKYSATLLNGVAETVTVPSTAQRWIMAISYQPGVSVWVSVNGTAEIPVGNTFVATTSEQNPSPRAVDAADVISFITSNTSATVGIAFYATPQ